MSGARPLFQVHLRGAFDPRHGSKRSPGNREGEQGFKEGRRGKMITQVVVRAGENGKGEGVGGRYGEGGG